MYFHWYGWLWVILGIVSVGIGGLLTTYGWNIWSLQLEKRKFIRKGIDCIIRGSIVVALGGLLSTHGWNLISLREQRNNLIRAVVQEWGVNNYFLTQSPIRGPVYYCVGAQKNVINPFQILCKSALDAVLESGLWDISDSNDEQFFLAVLNYKTSIQLSNQIFELFNENVFKTVGEDMIEKRIAKTQDYQQMFCNSPCGQDLFKQHEEIGRLLKTKYKPFIEKQWGINLLEEVPSQEKSQEQTSTRGGTQRQENLRGTRVP